MAAPSPTVGAPPPLAAPPAPLPLGARALLSLAASPAPPPLAAPLAPLPLGAGAPSGLAGVPPGPAAPPASLSPAAGAPPTLLSMASAPPAPPASSGPARPVAASISPPGHAFILTAALPPTVEPPAPAPTPSTTFATALAPMGPGRLLHSPCRTPLCFAPSCWHRAFHIPLDTTGGAPMHGCPLPATVYSQPSAITSSLRAPSDDAAAILAATRVAVTAARQRAQDAAHALEQEQAVVDAIERQYAETCRRLAGKGVPDGSPTSARYSADTFEPAPTPASTLRASLHAQAAALTNIQATVTDVLAPDSTQYPGGAIRSCRPSAGTPSPTTSSQRSLTRQRIGF
eukprot:XP_020397249.1 calphotin-like [Zea mays]